MMGRTPNIDSIAATGMLFTDHYGQPSCTAGRAAFIMGQLPVRTGMTTVGIPGSTRGIQKDTMEKMDPESHEWGYIGRKFFAEHLWAPNAATPFLMEHLKSLQSILRDREPIRLA